MAERLQFLAFTAIALLITTWVILTLIKGPEFECTSSRWEGQTYVPMECHWEDR